MAKMCMLRWPSKYTPRIRFKNEEGVAVTNIEDKMRILFKLAWCVD